MTMTASKAERREFDRFPLMMTAAVAQNGGNLGAVIFDISEGGAKVQMTESPFDAATDIAGPVTLLVPKFGKFEGEVIWIDDEYFGMKFNEGQNEALAAALEGLVGN